MDIKTYMEMAAKTDAPLDERIISSEELHNYHMTFGMFTEAAELADVFKKNMAYKKPIDWVNVKEEVGDLMWYIANFCRANGFDLEEIMQTNIYKLAARYPNKFSENRANNRNLSVEREILEK